MMAFAAIDNHGKGASGRGGAECESDVRIGRKRGLGRRAGVAVIRHGDQKTLSQTVCTIAMIKSPIR